MADAINPEHYLKFKITPEQYAMENQLDYDQGNVVKYVTRFKDKGGEEDLNKAIKYCELLKEFYYGK